MKKLILSILLITSLNLAAQEYYTQLLIQS